MLKRAGWQLEDWLQRNGERLLIKLLIAFGACASIGALERRHDAESEAFQQLLMQLSGRQTKRGRAITTSGLLAGLAGLIVIAINSSSDANQVGQGMELDAIAAVAVGGTLLSGGRAQVLGTLFGALIIQLIRFTLLAKGVPDAAALVVKAVIIIAAVALQQRRRRE